MPAKSKRSISELLKSSKAQRFLQSDLNIDLIDVSLKQQLTQDVETSKKQTSAAFPVNKEQALTSEKQTSTFETSVKQTSIIEKSEIRTTTDDLGLAFGGFLPLACSFFEASSFTQLGPGEIKLLLYLLFLRWRYPERPGFVRAALPYLERGTGITRSSVHAHLKHLSELGLIRCEELNKKIGNLYYISDSFLWKTSASQTTEKQTTKKQTSKLETTDVQISDVSSLESKRQSSEFQTKELDSLDSSILSLSKSTVVSDYLANIKAIQKREREKRFFSQLLNEYSILRIEEALLFLRSNGTLSGESCHSPLSYLANAGDQVFALMDAQKIRAAELDQKAEAGKQVAVLEREDSIRQEKLKNAAWECFRQRHPVTNFLEETLAKLIEIRLSKEKFTAPRDVLRNLVVMDWYNEQAGLTEGRDLEHLEGG